MSLANGKQRAPRRAWAVLGVLLGTLAAATAQGGQDCSTIHAIEVRGNRRMSADAVRFDLGVKPGDPWNDAKIRREYRRFWERGYFSDLRFFKRCDPEGAVLIVEIQERPTILEIDYQKVKPVSQQQIEDYYEERDFSLGVGSPLDRKKLWRAEALIRDLLGQKGYLDAKVKAVVEERSPSTRSVFFRIVPGGKTKIRKLDFVGNQAFKDSRLKDRLELTREWRWWWPFSRKALYHPLKYQQDVTHVLQYYRDHGYLDVDVRPPIVEVKTVRSRRAEEKARKRAARKARRKRREAERAQQRDAGQAEKEEELPALPLASGGDDAEAGPDEEVEVEVKEKKWVYLTIPVEEGEVYRLGKITFEGNQLFDERFLRALFPIREGSVLADGAIEAGLEAIKMFYGRRGYVYAVASRRFERHDDETVADVVVQIDEDQAYTIDTIEFRGNTTTRDEVLRRELNVVEGGVLDRRALDVSMQKLRQLSFWVPGEEPTLEPDTDTAEVDVIIEGEEQSRNEIQIGGGYSELEGGFFLASYQTLNLLGRGESLSFYASVGGRASRAAISFVEPWFMGKPYTFGFTVSRRSLDFGRARDAAGSLQRLSQTSTGGSIMVGKRIGNYSTFQVRYSYENITADTLDLSQDFAQTQTRIASITPLFNYRNVNNYLRPTRGFELLVLPQITSDLLGSEASYFKPRIESSWYVPVLRRFFFAIHGEVGWVRPFGGVHREAGFVSGVPRFTRFFMGGDTIGPRVFETRSLSPVRFIVPVDQSGNPVVDPISGIAVPRPVLVGGSKFGLMQLEFGIPIGRTATMAAFFDAGGVYDNGESWSLNTARLAAGFEFRVFLPVFQAPIRLIYGWPVREQPGDRTNSFQFSIGLPF